MKPVILRPRTEKTINCSVKKDASCKVRRKGIEDFDSYLITFFFSFGCKQNNSHLHHDFKNENYPYFVTLPYFDFNIESWAYFVTLPYFDYKVYLEVCVSTTHRCVSVVTQVCIPKY